MVLTTRGLLSALICLVLVGYVVVVSSHESYQLRDIEADWVVVHAVAHGFDPYRDVGFLAEGLGKSISRPGTSEVGESPWTHPRSPGALVVLYPLRFLDIDSATIALLVSSGLVLFWLAVVGVPRLAGIRIENSVLAVALMLGSAPIFSTFEFGTQSILIAAMVCSTWLGARGPKWFFGGIALGVAIVLKLWPVLLLAPLASSARWKMVGTALGAAAGLTGAGLLLVGAPFSEIVFALRTAAERWIAFSHNGSVGMILARAGVEPMLVLVVLGVAAAVVAWIAARRNLDLGIALAVVLGLVTVPLSWEHYNVVLLLVAAWFLGTQTRGRLLVWASVSIAALGMGLRSFNRPDLPVVGLGTLAERLLMCTALILALTRGDVSLSSTDEVESSDDEGLLLQPVPSRADLSLGGEDDARIGSIGMPKAAVRPAVRWSYTRPVQ